MLTCHLFLVGASVVLTYYFIASIQTGAPYSRRGMYVCVSVSVCVYTA